MKQYNKYLMIIFTFNLLFGVDKAGTTAAKFLSIGVGSKAVGMGGSYTSIADDATAMYWNPAGLSFHQTKEVYFNHSNWIADISFDYSGITIPIDNKSSLGFNITSVTIPLNISASSLLKIESNRLLFGLNELLLFLLNDIIYLPFVLILQPHLLIHQL